MSTPKKPPPKLGPKKENSAAPPATPSSKSTPRPSNAGLRKDSDAQSRPSASPAPSSTDIPKRKPPKLPSRQGSESSFASSQPRKPSIAQRRPSNLGSTTSSNDTERKPPKLQSRRQSEANPEPAPSRKASTAPRRPSNLGKVSDSIPERKKPPKLGPSKTASNPASKPAQQSQGQKALTQSKPKPTQDAKGNKAAHKVQEEEQDLKSILSKEQCEDVIQLAASITNQMRRSIEDNFNATAGLSKIGNEKEGEDKFASLDFDPGTVDVAAYDKERKLRDERQKELSTPKVKELKKASLKWFDDWRAGFLKRVDEAINPGSTPALERAQKETKSKTSLAQPRAVQTMSAQAKDTENVTPKLEDLFPRVPTSLTKMPLTRRSLVLHSLLLLLLSLEHYNAASRVFLLYLASSLKIGLKPLREDEEKTAKGLLEAAKQISASKESLEKGKEDEESRRWKMRLATVAGAAIVGLSGGYAAPMIAASVGAMMSEMGLGASAAAGYLGTVAGNTYLVGSLFGAYGGRMTGEMMRNLSADVEDFGFLPVHGERKEHADSVDAVTDSRRLRVVISISGWLLEKEEVVTPWRVIKPSAEVFALRFELKTLMSLGQSINTMSANDAYGFAESAFTQRSMVTDLSSAIWPIALVKIARVIENPFSLAQARAEKAGKVLAEALIKRTQGERPVTLVGYSVGARVIWSCLTTLAERRAFGLVESVIMLGAPIPSDIGTWRAMRTAVSGRLVNVYSKNDYLLAFLYRTTGLQYGVAGLMPISGLSGVENFDVSETVSGHLKYRYLVGSILQKIGFEDIDKNEVAIEADVYKRMSEMEQQNRPDYVSEVTKNAGEIYEKYAKRGKQPPTKKISDKDADKQVSAMEKEVQQKTQKGLMQWAVEQLYISPPSVPSTSDVGKAKDDPQAAAKGATKTANKTADAATKSMYQRAKDAVYISRSGGPEGQATDAAKGKVADTKGTAADAASSGYLATAAGYIPTSYIPGFGAAGDGKDKADKTTKKATDAADKQKKDVGKGAGAMAGKSEEAGAGEKPTKPKLKKGKSKSAVKDSKPAETGKVPESAEPDTTAGAQEAVNEPAEEEKEDSHEEENQDPYTPTKKSPRSSQNSTEKAAPATGGGYTSYLPSFGYGSSSSTKPAASKDKSAGEAKEADKSSDTTPTNNHAKSKDDQGKASSGGYGSYIPSFGWGRGGQKDEKPADPSDKNDESKKDSDDSNKEKASESPDPQADKSEQVGPLGRQNAEDDSSPSESKDKGKGKETDSPQNTEGDQDHEASGLGIQSPGEGESMYESAREQSSKDGDEAPVKESDGGEQGQEEAKGSNFTESEAEGDGEKKGIEDPFVD